MAWLVWLWALSGCGSSAGPDHADAGRGLDAATMDAAQSDARTATDAVEPRDAGPPRRVLFVGNSYTYFNDMPQVVRAIGEASGAPLEPEAITVGGATLADHWMTTGARERIAAGGLDFVVLQGQSVEPVFTPESFDTHAELFASALREAGAEGVWFASWGRRDVGAEPRTLMELIEERYEAAAAHNGDAVARVGAAWEIAMIAMPEVELFAPDGSHPSAAGSLLTSCVIFQALTGIAPRLPDPPPLGIAPDVARELCAIADEGVPCGPEESLCDGACIAWSADDCGGCGIACAEGDPCRLGVCGCPSGLTGCDGICTNVRSDARHCGACDASCALGAVCESGACACPPHHVLEVLDIAALTAFDASCDSWDDAGTLGCNAAGHAYCAAVGDTLDCFTSGLGPPSGHAPMPRALACVNGDVRTTTYTELATLVPACDGVTERLGADCTTAIHRYCAGLGAVSGFGPHASAGDSVTVTCISAATVVHTTMDTLYPFASRCIADAATCSIAAWNYCQSLGYTSGFGPVEATGTGVDVVCLSGP